MNRPTRSRQHGLSLIFALLALVTLSLAGVALVRSVSTGTLVLGNLGFKQAATSVTDNVTQTAIVALGSLADKTVSSTGYYASVDNTLLDATGEQLSRASNAANRKLIAWDAGCAYASANKTHCDYTPVTTTTANGLKAQYVMFRMCSTDGVISTSTCAMPTNGATGTSSARGGLNYAQYLRFGSTASPYYRIIVRVEGNRNAVSYTETIVHF